MTSVDIYLLSACLAGKTNFCSCSEEEMCTWFLTYRCLKLYLPNKYSDISSLSKDITVFLSIRKTCSSNAF